MAGMKGMTVIMACLSTPCMYVMVMKESYSAIHLLWTPGIFHFLPGLLSISGVALPCLMIFIREYWMAAWLLLQIHNVQIYFSSPVHSAVSLPILSQLYFLAGKNRMMGDMRLELFCRRRRY